MSNISKIKLHNTNYDIYDASAIHGEGVTSIDSSSTDGQFPSAKAVNTAVSAVDSRIAVIEDAFPDSADEENQLVTESDITDFITSSVNNLTNYYLRSDTYTRTEVQNLINTVTSFHYEVVASLPASGSSNVVYLLGPVDGVYDQYIYVVDTWTKIGETSVDISTAVSFSSTQQKTAAEKERARNNIGFVEISESEYEDMINHGTEDANTIYLTIEDDV